MKTLPIFSLLIIVLLAGCDRQKSDFVSACAADEMTEDECKCVYDLAEQELPPKDRDAFVENVIENGDVTGMFSGDDVGQSIVTGINLVGFVVKVEQMCAPAE